MKGGKKKELLLLLLLFKDWIKYVACLALAAGRLLLWSIHHVPCSVRCLPPLSSLLVQPLGWLGGGRAVVGTEELFLGRVMAEGAQLFKEVPAEHLKVSVCQSEENGCTWSCFPQKLFLCQTVVFTAQHGSALLGKDLNKC